MSFQQTKKTQFHDNILRIRTDLGNREPNFNHSKSLIEFNGFTEDMCWELISELEFLYKTDIPVIVDEKLTCDDIYEYL